MHITIIGASAGIGLECVKQGLEKGHLITALSTNTDAIPAHAHLTKINGSATSVADVKKAIKHADAVIMAIGSKKKKGTTLFSDSAHAFIQAAAEMQFTAPVLVITGFGAGDSRTYLSLFMRTVITFFLKDQYRNKTLMEQLLVKSGVKWEIVRPGMLTNGPLTKNYQVISTLTKRSRIGKISRADVADFLLREAENPTMLYQYPALTSLIQA